MPEATTRQVDDIQAYWNHRGRQEHVVPHGGEAQRDRFREHPLWLGVLPLLLRDGQRPLRRIADMGSGTGIVAEHLVRLGHEVIAVEFAADRAEHARRRLARYANAEVRVGDANDPPLAPGEVDAIISRNLIWLLPDPARAARRWRELVAPGGRVAAIDATLRLERSWDHSARARLLSLARGIGLGGGAAPVHLARPTPLSNAPHAGIAQAAWQAAGLAEARTLDLSWITSAKLHGHPLMRRWLNRSTYYAVLGDAV